jgi:hypothetical protein
MIVFTCKWINFLFKTRHSDVAGGLMLINKSHNSLKQKRRSKVLLLLEYYFMSNLFYNQRILMYVNHLWSIKRRIEFFK